MQGDGHVLTRLLAVVSPASMRWRKLLCRMVQIKRENLMTKKMYAVHKDGRKLYYPVWDSGGEIVNTGLPTAAVTIDQQGVTFPPGSIWIRRPRSSGLLEGWKLVDASDAPKPAPYKALRRAKRTRRLCIQCTKPFLAKRADARLCSQSCRRRSRRGLTATDNASSTKMPLPNISVISSLQEAKNGV